MLPRAGRGRRHGPLGLPAPHRPAGRRRHRPARGRRRPTRSAWPRCAADGRAAAPSSSSCPAIDDIVPPPPVGRRRAARRRPRRHAWRRRPATTSPRCASTSSATTCAASTGRRSARHGDLARPPGRGALAGAHHGRARHPRPHPHGTTRFEVAVSAAASVIAAAWQRRDLVRLVTTAGWDSGIDAGQAHAERAARVPGAGSSAVQPGSLDGVLEGLGRSGAGASVVCIAGDVADPELRALVTPRRPGRLGHRGDRHRRSHGGPQRGIARRRRRRGPTGPSPTAWNRPWRASAAGAGHRSGAQR